jgi:cell division protein FtsL
MMLLIVAAIIGVIVFLYMQMRKRKIENDLEEYEEQLQAKQQ